MSSTLYQALVNGTIQTGTAAGVAVTPTTALTNTAVLAAVRVLAESVASLPLIVYERLERGKQRAPQHWLYPLLHDAPNPEMTAFEWRELGMVHLALWGNFYNEIELSNSGRPLALWPLRPDRMTMLRDGGELVYRVDLQDGQAVELGAERVFHVRGMGSDGLKGYSLISLARQAIGLGLAAEEFGARFFGNGAVPGIVLQHPGVLGGEAYERLRNSWNERHQGLENAQRAAILEEGMTVEKIGIPPEDAQFLATRQFQVVEVARIFRIPPHLLMDLERATFSNIEQQSIEFVVQTLRPWLVRWEQAIAARLQTPADRQRYFAEFLIDGLLRGDTVSRYQAYSIGRQWGWLSANEIRELENANPVDGLDEYLVPMNMADATAGGQEDGGGQSGTSAAEEGTTEVVTTNARVLELRNDEQAAASRHRLQGTYRPVIAVSAQRIVNREVNDVGNAAKRYLSQSRRSVRISISGMEIRAETEEFQNWLDAYYAKHEQFIVDYLTPVVSTYTDLVVERVEQELGRTAPAANLQAFSGGVLRSLAGVWIGWSKSLIRKALEARPDEDPQTVIADVLTKMQEDRAEEFAADAAVRINNSVAVEAYKVMGVRTKRWVAFGENCPYCNELNGRSVEVGFVFLAQDGALAPAGVEPYRSGANIGHAPLHGGCDCMVVAG